MPTVKNRKRVSKSSAGARKVIHPKVVTRIYDSRKPLTVATAKKLLGWQPEKKKGEFKDDYLLTDLEGNNVRCTNNVGNRPFKASIAKVWMNEILDGHWQMNGETLVIGKTGTTISAQHRLVALVLAGQAWKDDTEQFTYWEKEPNLCTLMALGIDESDEVVNTVDTGIPRKLEDVVFRSGYFSSLRNRVEQVACARLASQAITVLWHRTGASADAPGGKVPHATMLDFLERHKKLLKCVLHIHKLNKERKLSDECFKPGWAAGFLYLMGSAKTDPDVEGGYAGDRSSREDQLDWSLWDKACEFWENVASRGKETMAIRKAMSDLTMRFGRSPTTLERFGIVSLAWLEYLEIGKVVVSQLEMEYDESDETEPKLLDVPTVGGADQGDPVKTPIPTPVSVQQGKNKEKGKSKTRGVSASAGKPKSQTKGAGKPNGDDPSPEQIAKRAELERVKRLANIKPKRAGDGWAKGDVAWVRDPDEHYLAKLTNDPFDCDGGDRVLVEDKAGGNWEVGVADLSLAKPKAKPSSVKPVGKFKLKIGEKAWVCNNGDEPWQGRVVEIVGKNVRLRVEQGHQGAGSLKPAMVTTLQREQPVEV